MLTAWLYCPIADRWARVDYHNGWYTARCAGSAMRSRDELEALAWAEWMLGRVSHGKAG